MGIYAALLPVPAAMALHGLSQLSANGARALLLRHAVDWRGARYHFLGAAVSVALFLGWDFQAPQRGFLIALGLVPFLALVLKEVPWLDFGRPFGAFLSGFLVCSVQLLVGVGGPLLDVFFTNTRLNRHQVVATKAFTQSASHLIKLVFYGRGLLQFEHGDPLILAAVAALACAGTWVGGKILDRMSDVAFRQATRWIVMGVGVVYLVRGLMGPG